MAFTANGRIKLLSSASSRLYTRICVFGVNRRILFFYFSTSFFFLDERSYQILFFCRLPSAQMSCLNSLKVPSPAVIYRVYKCNAVFKVVKIT